MSPNAATARTRSARQKGQNTCDHSTRRARAIIRDHFTCAGKLLAKATAVQQGSVALAERRNEPGMTLWPCRKEALDWKVTVGGDGDELGRRQGNRARAKPVRKSSVDHHGEQNLFNLSGRTARTSCRAKKWQENFAQAKNGKKIVRVTEANHRKKNCKRSRGHT